MRAFIIGAVALVAISALANYYLRPAASERAEAAQAAKAAEVAENERKGFHCLGRSDGTHRELVRQVKDSLREPGSFEHISTAITPVNADAGGHLLRMEYRARNGFGGMTAGLATAIVDHGDCSLKAANIE